MTAPASNPRSQVVPHVPERPLSGLEKVFWRAGQITPLNVTSIARVEGELTGTLVREALDDVRDRHPLLQVRVDDSNRLAPRFAPSAEGGQVARLLLRTVDTPVEGWLAEVERELNDAIDTSEGPLARCVWLRHGNADHHLLITFHHAIGDGMSGALMLRDLVERASLQSGAEEVPPVVRLSDAVPMDDRLPAPARGLRGAWNRVCFLARAASEDLRYGPPTRIRADQEASMATCRTRVLAAGFDEAFLSSLLDACRARGTTVHGALSSALALALAEDLGAGRPISIKLRSPVNMRSHLQPPVEDAVGMFASMTFFRGSVCATDEFWELAARIRRSVASEVERQTPATLINMLPRVYRAIGGDRCDSQELGRRWRRRMPTTSGLTNLGRLDFTECYGNLRLQRLHFAMVPGPMGEFACTATSFAGHLRLNFICPDPVLSDTRARHLTGTVVEQLRRAVEK